MAIETIRFDLEAQAAITEMTNETPKIYDSWLEAAIATDLEGEMLPEPQE